MPYLQLDIAQRYPRDVKRALAGQLGSIYAEVMQTKAEKVVIAVRELGEGNIWRCETPCTPAAVLKCDIRRGRSAEVRARLAERLIDACARQLNLTPDHLMVEFTQHPGEDFYRPASGWAPDWTPAEAS
jgi:phenylpyruvate tautomerase PptA (4-oxalocrotonate tautomerase family)